MTTDPEEGQRQIEAMKPPAIKVGDKVRLKAGERTMTVVELTDYGNMAVCEMAERDAFPVRSLVRVEPSTVEGV